MRPKLKSLLAILGFLSLGLAAALLSRYWADVGGGSVRERLHPNGVASSDRGISGLGLEISSAGLDITVPGCNAAPWSDNMFVHVYTKDSDQARYVNMDFNIAYYAPQRAAGARSDGLQDSQELS